MKWTRKYDGGLYVSGPYSITLTSSAGKFRHNRHYVVRRYNTVISGPMGVRLLANAKVLAEEHADGN